MVSSHSARDVADDDYTPLKLEDGAKVPIFGAALRRAPGFQAGRMPVLEGEVEEKSSTIF